MTELKRMKMQIECRTPEENKAYLLVR